MDTSKLTEAITRLKEATHVMTLDDAHAKGWFSAYDVYHELGITRQGASSKLTAMHEAGQLAKAPARRGDGKTLAVYHHA